MGTDAVRNRVDEATRKQGERSGGQSETWRRGHHGGTLVGRETFCGY